MHSLLGRQNLEVSGHNYTVGLWSPDLAALVDDLNLVDDLYQEMDREVHLYRDGQSSQGSLQPLHL